MKLIRYTLPLLWLTLGTTGMAETTVLVEAESFSELGGWVIDQQSMDQMGSRYVMAHALGTAVADANTTLSECSDQGALI